MGIENEVSPSAGQRWSREKPKEAGWYWYRDSADDDSPEVYQVYAAIFSDEKRLYVRESCGEGGIWIAYFDGEWQGPIVPTE